MIVLHVSIVLFYLVSALISALEVRRELKGSQDLTLDNLLQPWVIPTFVVWVPILNTYYGILAVLEYISRQRTRKLITILQKAIDDQPLTKREKKFIKRMTDINEKDT